MLRTIAPTLIALALTTALGAARAAEDVCSDCHEAPPVPEEHPAVTETDVEACGACHVAEAGDPYVEAVHGEHLEMGLECGFCHGDDVPPAERLEALLEP